MEEPINISSIKMVYYSKRRAMTVAMVTTTNDGTRLIDLRLLREAPARLFTEFMERLISREMESDHLTLYDTDDY
jgi:hypothetical protein